LSVKPKIYTEDDHHIRNDLIDHNALLVLKKLHEAGFEAYLVGGGVRDLLMRKQPKDFDISTSAKPEEIKPLFRRCFLIGRRFRLAHVRFGRQVIEVSTFRSAETQQEELVVQDNIWGSAEQDALRRDFTINGLFFDPLDHKIIDYVGGFEDLKEHTLRVIGDPTMRFVQDPVRMLRMQKFQARFGFHVEPSAMEALKASRQEIAKSSKARVLEELLRMLESASALPFFELLQESGLLEAIFATFAETLDSEIGKKIFAYLRAIDQMHQASKRGPLDRTILTAALVFPIIDAKIMQMEPAPHMGQIIDICYDTIDDFFAKGFPHFPRKLRIGAHFITQMQYRMLPPDRKRRPKKRIAHHKHFIEALMFLKVRSLVEPKLFNRYEYWKGVYRQFKEEKEDG